jgi:hypothetical protein
VAARRARVQSVASAQVSRKDALLDVKEREAVRRPPLVLQS